MTKCDEKAHNTNASRKRRHITPPPLPSLTQVDNSGERIQFSLPTPTARQWIAGNLH
jgi:hypothetical protein